MSYSDLLRDPRWQRKRLEVMERDEFRCRYCDADDQTLNVHHTYYSRGRKPWEYEDESLISLCEDCHKRETEHRAEIDRRIGELMPIFGDQILGLLRGMCWLSSTADTKTIPVESIGECYGICNAFSVVNDETIWALYNASKENWQGQLPTDLLLALYRQRDALAYPPIPTPDEC